jgi:hydrogenase-4 component B
MNHSLFLTAVGLVAFSGVPGLFFNRRSMAGQFISIVFFCAGSLVGLTAALRSFLPGARGEWSWFLPITVCGGKISFLLDPLASVFLVSIFLIGAAGSVYGLEYWRQTEHPENGRKLRFFYGTLTAGMSLVVVAQDSMFFLFSWEVMALSAFFLVSTEDEKKEPQQAGWVYFVATHFSTLFLFAFFAFLHQAKGTFGINPFGPVEISAQGANGLFLMALVAFGLKAGVFPFHVWLPSAHANAPSHVSAVLSGVLLKVGIYGLIRMCWLFPNPPAWWGTLLIGMGILSSVLGVAFAIGQHDLKRLLAYHSVENIGIIFLGLGLALWGRAEGKPDLVLLGMAGALLHVWNHGLFKSILFFAAGSVIHTLHTREIDGMGGLGKKMPRTALFFLIGAVAICGLPPLNGFVSEFLIFTGFLRSLGATASLNSWGLWMAPPALALTGGLALACFTKVFGAVFLGNPRTQKAESAKEGGAAILLPVFFLGALCFGIGLLPGVLAPFLESASKIGTTLLSTPSPTLHALVPFGVFTVIGFSLLLAFAFGKIAMGLALKGGNAPSPVLTWDCGYIRPSSSMQYSASSYAQILVDFFKWALVPEKSFVPIKGLFPKPTSFHSHVPETVLDRLLLPLIQGVQWAFQWFKYLQVGYLQAYVFYIFLAFMFFILWR